LSGDDPTPSRDASARLMTTRVRRFRMRVLFSTDSDARDPSIGPADLFASAIDGFR
jgi:hypothetical protein